MKTDEELRETYEVTVDEDNLIHIVFIVAETDTRDNGRQAELLVGDIKKIVDSHPDKVFNFLIDLTNAGSIHNISDRARKAYENLASFTTNSKAAVVGKSLFLEVTVNLIVQAVGRGQHFKWFEDVTTAREWLSEVVKAD